MKMTLIILFAFCFATAVYSSPVSDTDALGPVKCFEGPSVWCANLTIATECNAVKHCMQTVWSKDISSTAAALDPVKCFEGPTVWCANFSIAAKCNAVKHCIQTVWSNDISFTAVQSRSVAKFARLKSCSACVEKVNDIRDGMDSNTTKEVLQEALEYICEVSIFTRLVRKQCIQFIDEYVDNNLNELLDLLRSDLDAATICHILGFCSTRPKSSVPSLPTSNPNEDDAVAYYKNIVLHFPARNIQIIDTLEVPKPSELIGMNRCTWGPSYWCGNLTTSKECRSTSHCIQNVWPKKQYSEDNDSVCQVCKDMVKQARDQLLSNETQEELKEVFEGSCKLIPIKEVRKECIVLADEFVPELTEMLASEMNPTAVCTIAGLCNSRRIDDLIAANAVSNVGVDMCVNCTVAFTAVERFLKNSPKSDVLDRLLLLCGELSSYSDACSSLVLSNFENLYSMMTMQMHPLAACHLSGMCAYKYHLHPQPNDVSFDQKVNTMLAVKNDDLPCDLCKQLVEHFKEILVANTTEDEFLAMLKGMCQQTGKYKDECVQLVEENFAIFYKFLTEELDPVEICTAINLCPKAANFITDDNVRLTSGRLVPVLSTDVKFTELMPVIKSQKVGNVECRLCKSIISLIQREMEDPEFKGDIEKAIREVCVLVPSQDKQKCREFVDEYADTLIEMLSNETDPGVVCALLKLCPDVYAPKSVKNELCPLCQYVLHFIQEALEDPKDETAIEQAVEKVCNLVPDSMKTKCDEFISEYSALVISILSQEIDPSMVCPALKLCPSLESHQKRCKHCVDFLRNVVHQLDDNHEVDHIKSQLDGFMPKMRNMTATAVELKFGHYEDIVDMMTAEFNAEESCVYLNFCKPDDIDLTAGKDDLSNEISDAPEPSNVVKPSCEVCQLFVKLYEDKLTSNATEEQIEAMLTELCDKSSNPDFKNNCTRLVKKYVPVLAELVKKDVKPKDLCAMAKLCSLDSSGSIQSECSLCEMVIGAVEGYFGDPRKRSQIDSQLIEEIAAFCELMKGEKARSVCLSVVNQLIPQFTGIGLSIPGWFVCTKMDMCPYKDAMDWKLCTQPSTWCQDTKTAFLCDKLQHCQQNVWKSAKPSPQ